MEVKGTCVGTDKDADNSLTWDGGAALRAARTRADGAGGAEFLAV